MGEENKGFKFYLVHSHLAEENNTLVWSVVNTKDAVGR